MNHVLRWNTAIIVPSARLDTALYCWQFNMHFAKIFGFTVPILKVKLRWTLVNGSSPTI